jgi:hypothetical protein
MVNKINAIEYSGGTTILASSAMGIAPYTIRKPTVLSMVQKAATPPII